MAANAYQAHWPGMRVFALPSFYDGRVRVNLAGRERVGRVPLADYRRMIDEVKSLLDACVDPLTGEGVVDFYEQPDPADPRELGATESDLVIAWRGVPLGLEHPRLGRIGPVPFRRTGGHTGPHGVAWVAGDGVATGGQGVASAFHVVPTILDLLGVSPPGGLSGRSLLETPAANVRLWHSVR
jgi:predicted AlkP superfamily phosphohydrolase/phosphomutase